MSAIGVILWALAVFVVLFVAAFGIVGSWVLGELVADARDARRGARELRRDAAKAKP